MFAERNPSIIGNDYLVMGTVERKAWRASLKEPMRSTELLGQLHDFKEVWSLEFRPAGWYRDEEIEADERARAQAREQFEARMRATPRPAQPPKPRTRRRDKRQRKRR